MTKKLITDDWTRYWPWALVGALIGLTIVNFITKPASETELNLRKIEQFEQNQKQRNLK